MRPSASNQPLDRPTIRSATRIKKQHTNPRLSAKLIRRSGVFLAGGKRRLRSSYRASATGFRVKPGKTGLQQNTNHTGQLRCDVVL